MIEIKPECHCENPALEKAKEKGYELVCPDCHRWRKGISDLIAQLEARLPTLPKTPPGRTVYDKDWTKEPLTPECPLEGLALIQRCVDLAVEADMKWRLT